LPFPYLSQAINQLSQKAKSAFDQSIPAIGAAGSGQRASDIVNTVLPLGGVIVAYNTNASVNTADTVSHTLGRIPVGYIPIEKGAAGDVYDGGAAATETTLSLKCTTASNSVTLWVF